MKKHERVRLHQIDEIIAANLQKPDFQLEDITNILEISHAKLYRNLLKLTGYTPGRYIKKKRLENAREMLEIGEFSTVKETSRKVGFRRPEYFAKLFYEEYQIYPSKILKN